MHDASVHADPWPATLIRLPRLERKIDPAPALAANITDFPLVSIIMTTFNAGTFVQAAVNSILAQSHEGLELIIVDDASTDDTREHLARLAQGDGRIRVHALPFNRGTYWAKNVGIQMARGEAVTFMDSDDISDPERIAQQLQRLRAPQTIATLCNYVRVDETGAIRLNRGLAERLAPISLMVKRCVFGDVGHFDSVRTSADCEFIDRLKLAYGKQAIGLVEKPLYRAIMRQGSLSNQKGNGVSMQPAATDFLSPARAHYAFSYGKWHQAVKASGLCPHLPFPLTNRPFAVHGGVAIRADRFGHEPIVAFMASFPPRVQCLRRAVASLLPQVDRLYVYLNGYTQVPDFLHDERIVALPAAGIGDLKDVGKIFHQRLVPSGYLFTVDDDIEYPPDYCERLVLAVERHDRMAMVGVHGVVFEQPVTRYFSANRQVFHFRHALGADTPVNLLGTGTLCFHASTIHFNHTEMPVGMLDIGVAVKARQHHIPMIAIARQSHWLKPLDTGGAGETLYDKFRDNDTVQTQWLARQEDWSILPSVAGGQMPEQFRE